MEGSPATIGNSGNGTVSAQSHHPPAQSNENGGGGGDRGGYGEPRNGGGGFTEDVERNSGGNRWPKQETLALIRIRSEMDAAFRDSNLKAPLWDDVSRKLSELGFQRSAKKCREKFENVYKYHRRTKDGRTSKSDKTYRFSDQLQALELNPRGPFPPPPPPPPQQQPPPLAGKPPPVLVPMSNNYNATIDQNNVSPISVAAPAVITMPPPPATVNHKRAFPFARPTNSPSSSDTSAGEPPAKKKKKWEDLFEKMTKELINKQEELQLKFLETIDRRERDRAVKEEAWRAQEIAKMNVEYDWLRNERSIIAAKDAAIFTFLQKMIGKKVDPIPPRMITGEVVVLPSSPGPSRWPKAEISALITLRTQLDAKYQENVPKGPLWEEISSAMRSLGYNRNARRCKEKWENINKYYKKIKEGNRKRSEDSKTMPYFDQLDAIYREKTKPIVAQPEQQWPPPELTVGHEQRPAFSGGMEDQGNEDSDEYEDDYDDDEDEDSKVSSMAAL